MSRSGGRFFPCQTALDRIVLGRVDVYRGLGAACRPLSHIKVVRAVENRPVCGFILALADQSFVSAEFLHGLAQQYART
jgi:hypothetical protein